MEYPRLAVGTPSARDMLHLVNENLSFVPLDLYTDAMNVFELTTGGRGVPTERSQRIGILALREDRATRRVRHTIHIPTAFMLADPFTKLLFTQVFMRYVTTGKWLITPSNGHYCRIRHAIERWTSYDERDLDNMNQ